MKANRILNHLSFLTIGATWAVIIGLFYYFVFYSNPPMVITKSPTVDKSEYRAGDSLIYTMSLCKYIDSPCTMMRSWRDGLSMSEPAKEITGGVPGCYTKSFMITVPNLPPSSNYKLHFVYTYRVGPLLERSVKTISNSFDIIK